MKNPLHEKVSRLPALPEPLPPDVRSLFAERLAKMGRLLNIHPVFAHAPRISRASAQMAFALRNETLVPRLYVEIAIVRAAQNANGLYELQQHEPMLLAEGFAKEKLAVLKNWQGSVLFDAKERALLAYVDGMSDRGDVSDAVFADMAKHFNAQEITELSFAVGVYYGTALVMNALQIQLEKVS